MRAKHPKFLSSSPAILGLGLTDLALACFLLLFLRLFNIEGLLGIVLITLAILIRRYVFKVDLLKKLESFLTPKKIKFENVKEFLK